MQESFRVTQGSARAVWQFFDNQWIHPYLLAGLVAGGGAKLYFSSNVFANTTLLVTRSMSSTSVSWVAGLGMDF